MSSKGPVWDLHGRRQGARKPSPVPNDPRRFLFDGCEMTGFVEPLASAPSAAVSSPSPAPSASSRSHRSSPSKRRTYLDTICALSSSPGPVYDTTSLRHNPGHSSPKFSWCCGSQSSSAIKPSPTRNYLKPATPSRTSKFSSAQMVDWSTSTVSRNRASSVAALQRPIESRSGLRTRSVKSINVPSRSLNCLRKRPKLPWGNPLPGVQPEPSVMPHRVRFHKLDDRCSSLGGNFHEFLEESENSGKFRSAVTELEAHIQLRRAKIWRTLRPKGMDLLNFPKLFYEK